MIILEGCDCTGKTALADKLSAVYNAPITHYSKHDEDVMMEHAKRCEPGTDEIVDRFHMSEIPYSRYYRRTVPEYKSVFDIDFVLRGRKCLQIVCVPPWINVKTYWEDRRDDELIQSLDTLHDIYMWYKDKAKAFSSFQVWQYDYIITSFDDLCVEINTWSKLND